MNGTTRRREGERESSGVQTEGSPVCLVVQGWGIQWLYARYLERNLEIVETTLPKTVPVGSSRYGNEDLRY